MINDDDFWDFLDDMIVLVEDCHNYSFFDYGQKRRFWDRVQEVRYKNSDEPDEEVRDVIEFILEQISLTIERNTTGIIL